MKLHGPHTNLIRRPPPRLWLRLILTNPVLHHLHPNLIPDGNSLGFPLVILDMSSNNNGSSNRRLIGDSQCQNMCINILRGQPYPSDRLRTLSEQLLRIQWLPLFQ